MYFVYRLGIRNAGGQRDGPRLLFFSRVCCALRYGRLSDTNMGGRTPVQNLLALYAFAFFKYLFVPPTTDQLMPLGHYPFSACLIFWCVGPIVLPQYVPSTAKPRYGAASVNFIDIHKLHGNRGPRFRFFMPPRDAPHTISVSFFWGKPEGLRVPSFFLQLFLGA